MTETLSKSDLEKLAVDAKDALYLLQNTKSLAEDTKKALEDHLGKYNDMAQAVIAEKALRDKAERDAADQIKELKEQLDGLKKDTVEYKTRAQTLELLVAQKTDPKSAHALQAKADPSFQNFNAFWRKGELKSHQNDLYQFCPELAEYKTLRTDSDTQGGYLIPQIMDQEIRKNIVELSPIRRYARVRVSPGKSMEIPRRLALLLAFYEGETETSPTDQSTYGNETITCYRQTVTVPASLDMMVSSAFDIEREIASDVGESFAVGEGKNFVKGSGNKGPQGIVSDTRIEVVQTAGVGAANFAFDDMANIAGKLKRGQNPMWFFNRRTLSAIWSVKSTIGVPVWQPVAGEVPATIWGFPYDSNMIDLDDLQTGSNAKPILFGDMRRCYEIFDMMGMSVIRDDLSRKKEAITEWTFRRYNTGRVIIPEAMKILKIQ